MSRTIPQRELRNENAKILDAVEAGASFVITRHGKPIAELRPIVSGRRRFVPKAEIKHAAGTDIDAEAFRRDLDEAFDQSLRSD